MNALLGIDGGGTSTIAWLADLEGRVLGRGRAGPSNYKAVGAEAAREAITGAIAAAFAEAGLVVVPVESACFGLAGFDRPEDQELLRSWSVEARWARRVVGVNDGMLILAAGTPEGWGLGVIAGTGSIAVGRTREGRTARAGGWGPLLGDEGSGYHVALAALRRIARRADGRAPRRTDHDPLTDRLCAALGIDGPSRLVSTIYHPDYDRTRIAALAPLVVAAAEDDPALIPEILAPAGIELAETLLAVARALDWHGGPVPLAMAGGFLLSAPAVAQSLLDHLARAGYDAQAAPVPEPVQGALILARRALEENHPQMTQIDTDKNQENRSADVADERR
jgi:N-acetylglucosamine kinase-like BadF-type ATPase